MAIPRLLPEASLTPISLETSVAVKIEKGAAARHGLDEEPLRARRILQAEINLALRLPIPESDGLTRYHPQSPERTEHHGATDKQRCGSHLGTVLIHFTRIWLKVTAAQIRTGSSPR